MRPAFLTQKQEDELETILCPFCGESLHCYCSDGSDGVPSCYLSCDHCWFHGPLEPDPVTAMASVDRVWFLVKRFGGDRED